MRAYRPGELSAETDRELLLRELECWRERLTLVRGRAVRGARLAAALKLGPCFSPWVSGRGDAPDHLPLTGLAVQEHLAAQRRGDYDDGLEQLLLRQIVSTARRLAEATARETAT